MKKIFIIIVIINLLNASSEIKKHYFNSKINTFSPIEYPLFLKAKACFKQVLLSKKETSCLANLGLVFIEFNELAIIQEKTKQGGGFFIIGYNKNAHNMLSMPHRFSDTYTGKIGFKMMKNSLFKASAFNTVQRKIMDLAHYPYTFFTAFHLAFASLFPHEFIYQLHGFSNSKRKEKRAKTADMILSTGNRFYSQKILTLCKKMQFEKKQCLIYGKTTQELGATTNTQKNLLLCDGFKNFIHIEMNKALRTQLLKNKKIRENFTSILLEKY